MASSISVSTDADIHYKSLICFNSQTIFPMPITHNEILTIINCLVSSKHSGAHTVTAAKFIKLSVNVTAPILCNLYITNGVFPDILKFAYVILVNKSGPNKICNNYRPISLLSRFAKNLRNVFSIN